MRPALMLSFPVLSAAWLLGGADTASAQPDYPPAHYTPPVGCTKWYTSGNGHQFAVIHDMEGYYWTTISYLNSCSVSASIHYMVNGLQNGSDPNHHENNPNDPPAGDMTQSVREQNYAWHVRCWNRWSFGTEHEGFVSSPVWYTEEMYQASAGLQRHLCDANNIPKDRNHVIGHNQWQSAAWRTWITNNVPGMDPTCNTHTDPGQYWDWPHFMNLISPPGPTIVVQPQSIAVDPGAVATISVTATSVVPSLTYQWRYDSANLAGATGSSVTFSNAQLSVAGDYAVVVSDSFGTLTSATATLTVKVPPIINNQPQGVSVATGLPASFQVDVIGAAPMTYQWRLGGNPLAGATDSALNIPAVGSGDSGTYTVLITNAYGSALSSNAQLALVSATAVGDNYFLQLVVPPTTTNGVAVSAGSWHSLALRSDGVVLAWGDDNFGACEVPPDLPKAVGVAAGGYHSLALSSDGAIIGWGDNSSGQRTIPSGLKKVVAVAAGANHSVALCADGTVRVWGDNSFGQTTLPPNLYGVIAISAAGNHSLALKTNHTVVAWGENTDYEGQFAGQSVVPWNLTNAIAIAAGEYHSLAVRSNGTVVCWGDDSEGQCDVPAGLTNVVLVTGGSAHSLALKSDGTGIGWGANWDGRCDVPPALTNIVALSAGGEHSVLLLDGDLSGTELLYPARKGGTFTVWGQTLARKNYALEYKSSLTQSNWTPLPTVQGNSALLPFSDPTATNGSRIYRVRRW